MTVEIPTDLEPFVQSVINRGIFRDEAEVVREALRLMQGRERHLAQLRKEVETGVDSGESVPGDRAFEQLKESARSLTNRERLR